MSLIVPLLAIPKQHLSIQLQGQQVDIALRQLRYGLFIDVSLAGAIVVASVLCENLNAIVRSKYLGFAGDFSFYDMLGKADPDYTGLGDGGRFRLFYITPDELTAFAAAAA